MEKDLYILGIESSCDETAASIVKNGHEIVSNVVASQIESHKRFGGVVPEIASRKHIEKIQYPFMIRTLTKVSIEGTYLNKIKAIHDKPTTNIILNREKLNTSLLKSGTRMYTFTILFNNSIGSPSPK